jgi:hypothetical protein
MLQSARMAALTTWAAGAAGCPIWIENLPPQRSESQKRCHCNGRSVSLGRAAGVRPHDERDPFRQGPFGLRLLMRPDWDDLKCRASMHFNHMISLRGLQDFNYRWQGPYRTVRKERTRVARWRAAN